MGPSRLRLVLVVMHPGGRKAQNGNPPSDLLIMRGIPLNYDESMAPKFVVD